LRFTGKAHGTIGDDVRDTEKRFGNPCCDCA
jgi:hypothetical protein